VQPVLDWLIGLPVAALYASLAAIAALENIFPPVPADTVVAFGSFLAARGQGTLAGAFLATWTGNVAGALFMYWIGHRYGFERVRRRWKIGDEGAQTRVVDLYGRFGLLAIFVSRFLPGVRAVVPPFAGALRIGFWKTGLIMAVASAIWYGTISVIAYRLGTDWERVMEAVGSFGRTAAISAGVLALVILAVVWMRRRAR
jgi:membrane protein DedA with SNARE-associated domain